MKLIIVVYWEKLIADGSSTLLLLSRRDPEAVRTRVSDGVNPAKTQFISGTYNSFNCDGYLILVSEPQIPPDATTTYNQDGWNTLVCML